MNTKILMIVSALALGVAGVLLSFLPQEIASYLNLPINTSIVLRIMGALYFGFAALNWAAKGNLIGGIYSRPVALANFAHFLIGALALVKVAFRNTGAAHIWITATIYSIFAILFGYVLFVNPIQKDKSV